MTKWIIREVRVPAGLLDDRIRYTAFTEVDNVQSQFSRPGMLYIDVREGVLEWAKPGDTYVEESLDGRSIDEYEIIVEDDETGKLRISDDVESARESIARAERRPVTFEGWTYQWSHELALMIDNDQVLLRRVRDLVGEIIDGNWSKQLDMARAFRRRLWAVLDPGQQPTGECSFDGWLELLEHYEAQVLEERKHESND